MSKTVFDIFRGNTKAHMVNLIANLIVKSSQFLKFFFAYVINCKFIKHIQKKS